jgi:hypothetical protein
MELWTQKEVAQYFRVVSGTIKNWRDLGYLSYYRAPGSSRVLYFRDEIKNFIDKNSVKRKDSSCSNRKIKGIVERKPVVSAQPSEDWRI